MGKIYIFANTSDKLGVTESINKTYILKKSNKHCIFPHKKASIISKKKILAQNIQIP